MNSPTLFAIFCGVATFAASSAIFDHYGDWMDNEHSHEMHTGILEVMKDMVEVDSDINEDLQLEKDRQYRLNIRMVTILCNDPDTTEEQCEVLRKTFELWDDRGMVRE